MIWSEYCHSKWHFIPLSPCLQDTAVVVACWLLLPAYRNKMRFTRCLRLMCPSGLKNWSVLAEAGCHYTPAESCLIFIKRFVFYFKSYTNVLKLTSEKEFALVIFSILMIKNAVIIKHRICRKMASNIENRITSKTVMPNFMTLGHSF